MNYERMTQLALRGVVRDAIRRVIREDGLPGAHHFYITFLTRYPGVEIDEALSKKYPEEITIVLEHQFWDLMANADSFEVTLKFGGVPKYLKVPYTAITRFHDPSVGFALQFDPPQEMDVAPDAPPLAHLEPKSHPMPKPIPKKGSLEKKQKSSKGNNEKTDPDDGPDDDPPSGKGDKVISLDAFRKK